MLDICVGLDTGVQVAPRPEARFNAVSVGPTAAAPGGTNLLGNRPTFRPSASA